MLKIEKVTNPRLKQAIKVSGFDDLKLLELANKNQMSGAGNNPKDESKMALILMGCYSRMPKSKAKQQKYPFHEIQHYSFLLSTEQQQDALIEQLQEKFDLAKAEIDPQEIDHLKTILDFCTKHKLDIEACFDYIYETHPYFPLSTSTDDVQQFIKHFNANVSTFTPFSGNINRTLSNPEYRGVCHQLCSAKF